MVLCFLYKKRALKGGSFCGLSVAVSDFYAFGLLDVCLATHYRILCGVKVGAFATVDGLRDFRNHWIHLAYGFPILSDGTFACFCFAASGGKQGDGHGGHNYNFFHRLCFIG